MLQDEMFRKEIREAGMGSLFGGSGSGQRPTEGIRDGTGGTVSNGSSSSLIPDMGILSGLSSLSLGARRNLNSLAARFSKKSQPASSGSGYVSGTAENPDDGVSMSLLHRDSSARDDDEDDEEVIDFHGKSPSKKL
jgi:hypothetical protein